MDTTTTTNPVYNTNTTVTHPDGTKVSITTTTTNETKPCHSLSPIKISWDPNDMTWPQRLIRVLEDNREKWLSSNEIFNILKNNGFEGRGKTPNQTCSSALGTMAKDGKISRKETQGERIQYKYQD